MYRENKIEGIKIEEGEKRDRIIIETIENRAYDPYRGRIIIEISNTTECCEKWGYFISEDSYEEYIGAEIKDVYLTDRALKNYSCYGEQDPEDGKYLDIIFVNVETTKGVFQAAVYNIDGGYYGHEVKISFELRI